ncbi:retron system putative HNH endonuclease [Pseudomonas fluorescens]|uniref:retron system putative HNH endonuclease n=1 Tax=Pseudomonas fluorescens TaxID=294 RepID=UPI0009B9CD21|nr:retron system putative HNH endonuclease [Pseudomonas fluorescens]
MKRVLRKAEPPTLTVYRANAPQSTWQQMKNDAMYGGQNTYNDCRSQLIADAGGICAFCEIDIRENNPLMCRVEHFHPKADITPEHNWALDWSNLFAVCAGGSYAHVTTADHYMEPAKENLSCDAYKDQMITTGKLSIDCDGWIINPALIITSPILLKIEMHTGRLIPNTTACVEHPAWPNNKHADMETLVQNTIDMLNLNCDRLAQSRLRVIRNIEHNKKRERQAGHTAEQGMNNLARRYFTRRWPAFFTTIRLCLTPAADQYLSQINYQG